VKADSITERCFSWLKLESPRRGFI